MFRFCRQQKNIFHRPIKKSQIFLSAFLILAVWTFISAPVVRAQAVVSAPDVTASVVTQTVTDKWYNTLLKVLKKAGSIAFQRTLSTALNTIAYDAATYIGSGGDGQKPLYLQMNLGDYLKQVGDEAAGTFIESFVNNLNTAGIDNCNTSLKKCEDICEGLTGGVALTDAGIANEIISCLNDCSAKNTACVAKNASANNAVYQKALSATPAFNVCQPSSLEAKLRISLGLAEQTRPNAPNCTATQMIANWGTSIEDKIKDLQDPNFLNEFSNIFDPASNDLGIYLLARTDLSSKAIVDTTNANNEQLKNAGWFDNTNIAGQIIGVPGQAERSLKMAQDLQAGNLGKVTGDILVDSANVFLNQLMLTSFNTILKNLTADTADSSSSSSKSSYSSDPSIKYGEAAVKEVVSKILEPKFSTQADYDVLSSLSVCLDPENPGPDNCVIDSKFMQGISAKRTVAEAMKEGYLHSDWQFTAENKADSYTNSYSLRNISVLRKYRILPVGWEMAATAAGSTGWQTDGGAVIKDKKATLSDLVSCFDSNDYDYTDFSTDFDARDQVWCEGLVDPNWVLKAPLSYCKKSGVSAQILSKTINPGSDTSLSELSVVRAEDYCADNQTCIKEKEDGSCEVYGYCNEEQRTWSFGAASCQPIYNTCQSFTNNESSKAVSYLENTLNYSNCNSSSAGCRQYSYFGPYDAASDTVSWNQLYSRYFNSSLGDCSNDDEGCTELLRVKPTWGSNLVLNADFAADTVNASSTTAMLNRWPIASVGSSYKSTIVDSPLGNSGKAILLEASGAANSGVKAGIYSDYNHPILPTNFQIQSGASYTLSADVYLTAGDYVRVAIGSDGDIVYADNAVKNSWQRVSITRRPSDSFSEPDFSIIAYSASAQASVFVKNIKFEMSDWATSYSAYGSFKIYEKLLPNYLEQACYENATGATKDYRLKAGAPAVCSRYARKCNREEVGCELYTAADESLSVPAKTASTDYCPAECVGYDVYISKGGYFNRPEKENMLPDKATRCVAASAGCSEFTNLDSLAQGGESREYYTSLKQCIKPSTAECASFYSWEGTGNAYQLKAYSLKKDALGNPAVTSADGVCSEATYNLPVDSPNYNADCREFYNAAGTPSYRLASRTITCSDSCRSYRLSAKNIDKDITSAAACSGSAYSDAHWDAATASCYVCLNGGTWDTNNNACVYKAIPGEGQSCTASENGCREYNGNSGSNVRLLSTADFEGGSDNWTSNCSTGVSVSTVSNTNDGHSLSYNDSASGCAALGDNAAQATGRRLIERVIASDSVAAQLPVGNSVREGSAYTLKFLARATSNTNLNIFFLNKDLGASGTRAAFNSGQALTVTGGNEWNIYQVNLDNLDHKVGAGEVLAITANGNFFIDNIILSEITDRYYLIRNSSQIPTACFYNFVTEEYAGADYNLGCAQYIDRDNLTHNLRKFSQLCASSAVGCEQVIDTKNSAMTGDDSALYAVYDETKTCNSSDKGCSRFGQGQGGTNLTGWKDVYKLNRPDDYSKTSCAAANVGCEAWTDSTGAASYFKDPGTAACVYRAGKDAAASGQNWYKIPVKRCDLNNNQQIDKTGVESAGPVCTSDSDCDGKSCLIDNNDYLCSTVYSKTIGLGGAGNQVPTPDADAGLCDPSASGCTEYIDPLSQFAANLVSNNYWGVKKESWTGADPTPGQQIIELKLNRLYSLSTVPSSGPSSGGVSLTFLSNAKLLGADNKLSDNLKSVVIVAGSKQPIIFNSLNNRNVLLYHSATDRKVVIKELAIAYQKESDADKTSCNGTVKFDNGCVLFNERSINGASGLANLSSYWDAYQTIDGGTPQGCSSGSCNANALIKVRPDRTCSKWLDCTTYGKDSSGQKVCYALGECNQLNDKNECSNYISVSGAHNFNSANDKNSSGYSLLGKYYLGNMKEVGVNTDAHFDFENFDISLSCRPVGKPTTACSFNESLNSDTLILGPEDAPADYPAHGRGYLKVPGNYEISPLAKDSSTNIYAGQDYYINYLVNTEGTGMNAKVIIEVGNGAATNETFTTLKTFIDDASSGWERKVHKFSIKDTKALRHIKIRLTSETGEQKNVYFDDINIEPVLKTGDTLKADDTEDEANNYIAKDCRLYPGTESLSCLSKNNNVIQDGLYGYCLQYDAYNPGVCALWYPIDQISSISKGSTLSGTGYQGQYPLYYCTEANGNFQLVKKIEARWVASGDHEYLSGFGEGRISDTSCGTYQHLFVNDDTACVNYCGDCSNYELITVVHTNNKDAWYYGDYFCVPRKNDNGGKIKIDGPLFQVNNVYSGRSAVCDNKITYEAEAWVKYDGKLQVKSCSSSDCDGINEAMNNTPPVGVYESGDNEDTLKFITAADPNDVYRIKCNRFSQLVDGEGNNKAWSNRVGVSSQSTTETPDFFNTSAGTYTSRINLYGRNRESVPFGVAVLPNDFQFTSQKEPINLRGQYSAKNNETTLAGRPYGCSGAGADTGCSNIGYCSANPNVFCIYDSNTQTSYDINKASCNSGGYGTCRPLWSTPLSTSSSNSDNYNILKTVFLNQYAKYAYSNQINPSGSYEVDDDRYFDWADNTLPDPCNTSGLARDDANKFCSVFPKIGNLKIDDKALTGGNVSVLDNGIRALTFTSAVDKEQQPLKQIIIDWGDDSIQVITGEDDRPLASEPHIFYHYYVKKAGNYHIQVKIYDNWGMYGCTDTPCTL